MADSDWIDRTEYPFQSHYMDVPAGRMHFVDEGAGEPVVMVHGNPTWSFLYRDLIKRLRPDYRCIAPDHIGFGLSDKPGSWSYHPGDHAHNLAALIESLELDRITLVLHDWGGPLGLAFALAHPDKIARIVLINTWAWPINHDPRFVAFSRLMAGPPGRLLIRRYNAFARLLLPLAFGDRSRLSRLAHAHYQQPLAQSTKREGCIVFAGQLTAAAPWLERLWQSIAALRDTPALLVWGMKDPAFRPRELRRWQAALPQARSLRLRGVGHLVPEEAPEALSNGVLSFLAQKRPPPE